MSEDIEITPELEAQAAELAARIAAEPNVWERIALMNDARIPFAVRLLATLRSEREGS